MTAILRANAPAGNGPYVLYGVDADDVDNLFELLSIDGGLLMALRAQKNKDSDQNAFLASHGLWNYTAYNPRVASTGATKGAAGSVGNVEVLLSAVPAIIDSIITENDTAAGDILVRDAAATGSSVSARAFAATLNTVTRHDLGWQTVNGLTICGSATGVCFVAKWRPR